jgi:hypothetical protein
MPDTGAPWNIPYLDGTELIRNYPSDSLSLANAVDAALDLTKSANNITSDTFNVARIPNLDAAKITSGTFNAARIPGLDASKIVSGKINPARLPMKRIARFTGNGTWTVPAGVTYAIAHMMGGGGGVGQQATGGNGGNSSVAFSSGTVVGPGARGGRSGGNTTDMAGRAGLANTGGGASRGINTANGRSEQADATGGDATFVVAGAAVTPGAGISVVVGAGGAAGSGGGAAGGSGYVYIEFYE